MTDQEVNLHLEICSIISEVLLTENREIPLDWTLDDVDERYSMDSIDREEILERIEMRLGPESGFSNELKYQIRYELTIEEIIEEIIKTNK